MSVGVSHVLPAIYDAALSDEHWPRALSLLSEQLPAVGAFLIAVDQVGLPFVIREAASTYRPEDLRYYFEHLGHYDAENIAMTERFAPFRLLRDCDLVSDLQTLDERPDYKWMRDNIGARRKAGARLSQGKGWMDLVAFQFASEWDASSDALQGRLDEMLPHVAKVVEINRKFAILRHQYQAVLTALDNIRIGTCVAGSTGHIVVANNEAQRIFSLKDGLSLSRMGFLTGVTGELTTELGQKIAAAASTARGEGDDHEALVFIDRRSGARPFLVEISPLRDSVGELERHMAGALIFIIDPESHRSISTRRLALLHGLSEAEAEICKHMVGGGSAAEIAESRGVSEGTVKTQFKAIYAKTGVHRRADLVRLAIAIDPPIDQFGEKRVC
jgi:DNA-binding CsgD family transcriptional regulator